MEISWWITGRRWTTLGSKGQKRIVVSGRQWLCTQQRGQRPMKSGRFNRLRWLLWLVAPLSSSVSWCFDMRPSVTPLELKVSRLLTEPTSFFIWLCTLPSNPHFCASVTLEFTDVLSFSKHKDAYSSPPLDDVFQEMFKQRSVNARLRLWCEKVRRGQRAVWTMVGISRPVGASQLTSALCCTDLWPVSCSAKVNEAFIHELSDLIRDLGYCTKGSDVSRNETLKTNMEMGDAQWAWIHWCAHPSVRLFPPFSLCMWSWRSDIQSRNMSLPAQIQSSTAGVSSSGPCLTPGERHAIAMLTCWQTLPKSDPKCEWEQTHTRHFWGKIHWWWTETPLAC